MPVFAGIGIGLWYILNSGGTAERRRRWLLRGGLGLGAVIVLAGTLFRWDDTYGGTSLVKPTWRWAPRKEEIIQQLIPAIPAAPASNRKPVEGVLRDWTRYLGEDGDGVVRGVRLETDWEAHPPRLLWKRPVGTGWASFAVTGRTAITLEQRGQEEWVTAYDVVTGDPVWSHADPLAEFTPAMGGRGPRSTPLVSGGRVFTQGVLGRLNALDAATGRLLWSREVLAELGAVNLEWGKSNSPTAWRDTVVVTGGMGKDRPLLAAYRMADGSPAWTSEPGAASYATPVILDWGGKPLLVSVNQLDLTAHDPDTGARIWKWEWPGTFPKVGQPQRIGEHGLLVTAAYGAGSFLLDLSSGTPAAMWKSTRMKTKFSTALVRDGHAYGFDEGVFACIDLATGDRKWKGGRYGFGQNLLVDDVILIQAENGALALVAADPTEFREVARLDALTGVTWNVPTLAGNHLLIRNDTEAACYWLATKD